jgi:septation ring formation regulator EzrA
MNDAELMVLFKELKDELVEIKERLRAVEKEQRKIIEDLLSVDTRERTQKRILEQHPERMKQLKRKIDEDINIKI